MRWFKRQPKIVPVEYKEPVTPAWRLTELIESLYGSWKPRYSAFASVILPEYVLCWTPYPRYPKECLYVCKVGSTVPLYRQDPNVVMPALKALPELEAACRAAEEARKVASRIYYDALDEARAYLDGSGRT